MNQPAKKQLAVWWVLWAAFQTGVFVFYEFLGVDASRTQSSSPDTSAYMVGLAPVVLSAIIRWVVLPRARTAQAALPLFIVGMAIAETTSFLGLFMFPSHSQQLCMLSAFGILQFIPFFARRYFHGDGPTPGL